MRIAVVGAVVLVSGCVTPLARMDPLPAATQEVEYRNGTPTVVSRGPLEDVAIAPSANGTGRYEFTTHVALLVGIRNRSDRRIEVSESSVSVTVSGFPARVLKATEIEDSIRSSAASAQAANAIAGTLNAMAATQAGRTTYTGTVAGAPVYVTANDAGAGADAVRGAAEDTRARALAIQAAEQQQLATVAGVFQRNTVRPGESYQGLVVFEPGRDSACVEMKTVTESAPDASGNAMLVTRDIPVPKACVFHVEVNVGGEVHAFDFNETPPR